ncbi:TonB-dependent receptor plug domain-containing protein [Gilvibacter sp.]|uniref:TonB-dependent receptor plug domain-containing protein n=1 Tax=Gilvibacter sp. TaxID=2729997 RepID=UPI003F49BB15
MKRLVLLFTLTLLCLAYAPAQDTAGELTLLYDTSYDMQDKDFAAELQFLDSYFNQNPEIKVRYIAFSNTVIQEGNYTITGGNWTGLRRELEQSIYDGAGNYDNLFDGVNSDVILVTNGRADLQSFPSNFKHKINVICSVTNSNQKGLEGLALRTGGTFFNVFATTKEVPSGDGIITVSGTVADGNGALEGVSVFNRETGARTLTDASGNYSLNAKINGILEFTYVGKNSLLTRVPEDGKKNVQMIAGSEVLDEVILTATLESNEDEVNTGNMRVAKKRLGYSVETITDEAISDQDINLETAIQGQFSNINLKNDQDISQFLSRGNNMSILLDQTGLIVVDGVPIESSPGALSGVTTGNNGIGTLNDRSIFGQGGLLDPANIADITVLKGLAATNKYGTLGRNGVILVTTKTAAVSKATTRDSAIPLGTTATYTGSAEDMAALPDTPYMKALQRAKDIDEAYNIYLEQRQRYGRNSSFFIDAASYFKDWNNAVLVSRVLSNAKLVAKTASELRATAYQYENLGLFNEAVSIYQELVEAWPEQIQNYRNLALAQEAAGMPKEALEIYKAIDNKTLAQNGQLGNLQTTYVKEYKNLLFRHRRNFDLSGVRDFFKSNVTLRARVIFEWSDYDAAFDLQIVNPQNRFFTWKHDQTSDAFRWADEQSLGYGLEEFFMTNQDVGEWLFNVNYKGKITGDNALPTYLKVTVIYDFGTPNQKQEVQLVRLEDLGKEQTVLKVNL